MTDIQLHETVNDILDNLEAAEAALKRMNDALYCNDGELGELRIDRCETEVLVSKIKELKAEVDTLDAAKTPSNLPVVLPEIRF